MKRYFNNKTNKWYIEGRTVTLKVNNTVFSGIPTEEQLSEWGYKEYIEPTPQPLTEEQIEFNNNQRRMSAILAELKSMDYLTSKFIDGEDMSDYGDWQDKRKALREEYRELELLNKSKIEEELGEEPVEG